MNVFPLAFTSLAPLTREVPRHGDRPLILGGGGGGGHAAECVRRCGVSLSVAQLLLFMCVCFFIHLESVHCEI